LSWELAIVAVVHWAGDGAAWKERNITVAQERELAEVVGGFWALAPLAHALIDDAARRGPGC
jgi:hypothetical protein